jgi:N-formylglutamate amidohydrolase
MQATIALGACVLVAGFAWSRAVEDGEPVAPKPAAAARTELAPSDALVVAWRGDLPLVISAPHGGRARVEGGADRETGVVVRDEGTAELALLVAQRVIDRLGAKPYVVVAQFSRKDADANRPAEEAYENEAAGAQWRAYHHALRMAVDECRERFGEALLVDLHGQAREPDVVARGTRDGRTMARLRERLGEEWLLGPRSLDRRLAARGHRVVPEPASDGARAKETLFAGGHIVATYGATSPGGIDAMQFEFGRQRDDLRGLARDLGDSLAEFLPEAGYLD